jgi:hypothetical protein
VPDVVGQDDEEPLRVQQLAFPEEAAGERLGEKPAARAAGAVQNQDAVPNDAIGPLLWSAEGPVVQAQLWQHVSAEAGRGSALDGSGIRLGRGDPRLKQPDARETDRLADVAHGQSLGTA